MHRAAIYFFYDADGVADDYVGYFLADLVKNVDRLVVVSNGPITPQSRDLFAKYTHDILIRDNKGMDVWAYRFAIDFMTWDELRTYDEVVLLNFTIMGPVYPLSEMFEAMESRDVDFWGITKFGLVESDPTGQNPYHYLPEHIQSHFTVYRKRFLEAPELKNYWDHIPVIRDYHDAVGKHESYFTKHFADMGFRWEAYIDPDEADWVNIALINFAPVMLIDKYRCPIFKRRSFFHDKATFLYDSTGEASRELLHYLETQTDYPTDLIWRNIIRACHAADIVDALGLTYVLPDRSVLPAETHASPLKTVLVMHLFFIDLIESSVTTASVMPPDVDIIITTPKTDSLDAIREAFDTLPNDVQIVPVPNRGRDVAGLVLGALPLIQDYDLACFYHDKKSAQNKPASVGMSFAYRVQQNTLASREFVDNVRTTFADQPYLGLLAPPPPNHGPYYPTVGKEWQSNFANTKDWVKRLDLRAPISEKVPPIAPLGTVFWFRPCTMAKLLSAGITYKDFPREDGSVTTDGGPMHAIERAYPFVVQDAGYYPAWLLSSSYAGLEYTNLYNHLRLINKVLYKYNLDGTTPLGTQDYLDQHLNWAKTMAEVSSPNMRIHLYLFTRRKLRALADRARHWVGLR